MIRSVPQYIRSHASQQPKTVRRLNKGVKPAFVPAPTRLEQGGAEVLAMVSPKKWLRRQETEMPDKPPNYFDASFSQEISHENINTLFTQHQRRGLAIADMELPHFTADTISGTNRWLADSWLVKKFVKHQPVGVPHLNINKSGTVTGHEGRHRMRIAEELGIEYAPTILAADSELRGHIRRIDNAKWQIDGTEWHQKAAQKNLIESGPIVQRWENLPELMGGWKL